MVQEATAGMGWLFFLAKQCTTTTIITTIITTTIIITTITTTTISFTITHLATHHGRPHRPVAV